MLTRYDNDGIELIIDNETGEAFASVRGYARMAGISHQAVLKRVAKMTTVGGNQNDSENDETYTQQGFETGNLQVAKITTNGGLQNIRLISESLIIKWIVGDNPELAKQMLLAGCRLYLYGVAGYQVKVVEPTQSKLPPSDIRVVNLSNALMSFGIELDNPRFKQGFQDLVVDMLGLGEAIVGDKETWLGVAERAEQLGYPVGLVTKHRSELGKWTAKHELTRKREKRLCNGTQREINVYLVTSELDNCIKEYLDVKMLSPVN